MYMQAGQKGRCDKLDWMLKDFSVITRERESLYDGEKNGSLADTVYMVYIVSEQAPCVSFITRRL